jgi:hypothetical protein
MSDETPLHRRNRLNPMGLHALTCAMCRRRIHPLPVREDAICDPCHNAMVEAMAADGIAQLERLLRFEAGEE